MKQKWPERIKKNQMTKVFNISGITLSASSSNSTYKERDDSAIITIQKGNTLSGRFTNNKFKAAPVKLAINHLSKSTGDKTIFIINSGNANAGTGARGDKDVMNCCMKVAKLNGINTQNVIPFSTGVIGKY